MIKRALLASILALSAASQAATYTVPTQVTVWSEGQGQKVLQWAPSEAGYRAWYRGGWNSYFKDFLPDSGCRDGDVSDYSVTPCMIKATFDSMERSLREIGLDVRFDVTTKVDDQETACTEPDCIHAIANRHVPAKLLDVIMIPVRNSGAQGTTRQITNGQSTVVLHLGKQWAVGALHLARHEFAHALGFDGHLYENDLIVSKCAGITVKPYSQSGLPPSCKNNTFVGSLIKPGEVCSQQSMNKQRFFDETWNVPVYADAFKKIFACYLNAHGTGNIPAPPAPPPTPAPCPCSCPK